MLFHPQLVRLAAFSFAVGYSRPFQDGTTEEGLTEAESHFIALAAESRLRGACNRFDDY